MVVAILKYLNVEYAAILQCGLVSKFVDENESLEKYLQLVEITIKHTNRNKNKYASNDIQATL